MLAAPPEGEPGEDQDDEEEAEDQTAADADPAAERQGDEQHQTEADQQAMQKMSPEQIATLLGTKMGLIEFVKSRGISEDQAKACLSDKAAIDGLIKTTEREFEVAHLQFFLKSAQKAALRCRKRHFSAAFGISVPSPLRP